MTGFVFACGAADAPASTTHDEPSAGNEQPDYHDDPQPTRHEDPPPPTRVQNPSLDSFEADILAAHNAVRANVSPAASPPIPPLEWDPALARQAADWANRCPTGHRPNNDHGENIYWSGGMEVTPEAPVRSWASEAQYYDYRSTVCSRDGRRSWAACGHYTQLVWRETTRVGCAVRRDCSGQMTNVVVCNYDPPGNINVGDTSIPHPY